MLWPGNFYLYLILSSTVPATMAWLGLVWLGLVWFGLVILAWFGYFGLVWLGLVWLGSVKRVKRLSESKGWDSIQSVCALT